MAQKAKTAVELCGENPQSEAYQLGRRLKLRFINKAKPELDRIEFQANATQTPEFWQRGDSSHNFAWTEVPQAVSLLLLDYVCADPKILTEHFSLRGTQKSSLAASLGDAIYQPKHGIHDLLVEAFEKGGRTSRVQQIFGGDNVHGKRNRERRIQVKPDYLPQDCVEIYWDSRGPLPLSKPVEFKTLSQRIQKSLGIEITEPEIEPLEDEKKPETQPQVQTTLQPQAPSVQPAVAPPAPVPPPPQTIIIQQPTSTNLTLPDLLLTSFAKMASAAEKFVEHSTAPQRPPPVTEQGGDQESKSEKPQPPADRPKKPPFKDRPKIRPTPAFKKIDAQLFQIQNPSGLAWDDFDPLLNFGNDDSDADVWRIRDACEGVLIFGGVGSGKTSGSGGTLARAFLQAGFGGLVLTVKSERRLDGNACARKPVGKGILFTSPRTASTS